MKFIVTKMSRWDSYDNAANGLFDTKEQAIVHMWQWFASPDGEENELTLSEREDLDTEAEFIDTENYQYFVMPLIVQVDAP